MAFGQTMRNLKRIKQIANALFSNQLGYVVDRLNLRSTLSFKHRLKPSGKPTNSIPLRIRSAMEDLGGTFVKLGQLLSLRYDLLPKEYCDEFSKLQEGVRPFNFSQVKQIIEKELKKPIKEIFKEFEQQPIAAASVGQVHKAVLKNGELVAIKIQRPDIELIFEADIDLLYHLARLLDKRFPEIREYDPIGLVQEFERYTKRELDYLFEAKNIDIFYENFKEDKKIKVPKVHWDYTTSKVLTMEFIDGHRISQLQKFSKLKENKRQIVRAMSNAFIKSVLEDGVFHADPHPGNIFVLKDGSIALLDFGIVGKLTPELKSKVQDILVAMVSKDVEMLAQTVIDIGIVDEGVNLKQFKEDLIERFGDYYGVSFKQVNTVNLFFDALTIGRKYKMKFPTAFTLLIKAIVTTHGFANQLDPDFNFIEECKPAVEKLMITRTKPSYVFNTMRRNMRNFRYFLSSFPQDITELIRTFKRGALFNVDIDNKDIKKLTHEIDASSNRLTFGMIIAALILASALFIYAKLEPLIFGIPLTAIISLIAAFFVALCLVTSILREQEGGEY
ncbi:MAG: AarF/ABC1/UbiB kinase family protein [archaeon]